MRQVKLRSWLADADFRAIIIVNSDMSNRVALSVYALEVPVDNDFLDNSRWSNQCFLLIAFIK